MTAIRIPLENYYTGSNRRMSPCVVVDDDVDGFLVGLTFEGEGDDPNVDRTLTPGEARAIAAALVHFADEQESC